MKKFMFRATTVAMCAMMMASVFSSCNANKPDDPKEDPKEDPKTEVDTVAVAAVMNIDLWAAEDMLKVIAFSVEYLDEDGKAQTAKYEGGEFHKEIKSKGLPASLGIKFAMSKKEDVDLTQFEEFLSDFTFSYSAEPVNAAGKYTGVNWSAQGGLTGEPVKNPIDKLDQYLTSLNKRIAPTIFEYDEKGKLTEKAWE